MQLDRRAFVGGERFSETWPFTGVKGELLEGGIRMPLLAMTGGNGATAGTFDGLDLSAQLTGRAAPVDRTLYGRFKANGQAALRQGNWKHLKLGDKEHLFDLASDARTCRSRARRSRPAPGHAPAMGCVEQPDARLSARKL